MRIYDTYCPDCGTPTELEENSTATCKKCKLNITIEKIERCDGCKTVTMKYKSSLFKNLSNEKLLFRYLNNLEYNFYDMEKEILKRMRNL